MTMAAQVGVKKLTTCIDGERARVEPVGKTNPPSCLPTKEVIIAATHAARTPAEVEM